MTNVELLVKIKAEIERRMKILREDDVVRQNCTSDFLEGKIYGYEEILSLLATFESEKPMQKGLDVTDFCKPIDPGIAQCIADHSWEMLGEDEKPVPKDLEEAAEKSLRLAGFHNMETRGMDWKGGFISGAKWDREQMMKDFPKWRRIKDGERLPCPAYVWTIAYDNYPDCFEGRLMPNIQGVKVGRDTWYLPVDVIHNLPKEDEK